MATLSTHRYGKHRVRLVKVTRHPDRHDLKEFAANILLEGDFESCYRQGDNSRVLPTDTMKNTVYALARQRNIEAIEDFAQELVMHFLKDNPQVQQARVEMVETLWSRVVAGGQPHRSAFQQQGPEKRTTAVTGNGRNTTVSSGIDHLVVLKTADSAFEGYVRDQFTTLREAKDRLLGTEIRAQWRYSKSRLPFNELWSRAVDTLKQTFSEHKSLSVQHTLFAIGQSVLSQIAEIEEIYLCMPNKHCLLVDLSPFGLSNPNEIFVPIDEPHGYIEARVTR